MMKNPMNSGYASDTIGQKVVLLISMAVLGISGLFLEYIPKYRDVVVSLKCCP